MGIRQTLTNPLELSERAFRIGKEVDRAEIETKRGRQWIGNVREMAFWSDNELPRCIGGEIFPTHSSCRLVLPEYG